MTSVRQIYRPYVQPSYSLKKSTYINRVTDEQLIKDFFGKLLGASYIDIKEFLEQNKLYINNIKDENLNSPLHIIIDIDPNKLYKIERYQICDYLIKNNANLNALNRIDIAPLHLAAQYQFDDIVELLLNSKANINIKNIYNQNALVYAVKPLTSKCPFFKSEKLVPEPDIKNRNISEISTIIWEKIKDIDLSSIKDIIENTEQYFNNYSDAMLEDNIITKYKKIYDEKAEIIALNKSYTTADKVLKLKEAIQEIKQLIYNDIKNFYKLGSNKTEINYIEYDDWIKSINLTFKKLDDNFLDKILIFNKSIEKIDELETNFTETNFIEDNLNITNINNHYDIYIVLYKYTQKIYQLINDGMTAFNDLKIDDSTYNVFVNYIKDLLKFSRETILNINKLISNINLYQLMAVIFNDINGINININGFFNKQLKHFNIPNPNKDDLTNLEMVDIDYTYYNIGNNDANANGNDIGNNDANANGNDIGNNDANDIGNNDANANDIGNNDANANGNDIGITVEKYNNQKINDIPNSYINIIDDSNVQINIDILIKKKRELIYNLLADIEFIKKIHENETIAKRIIFKEVNGILSDYIDQLYEYTSSVILKKLSQENIIYKFRVILKKEVNITDFKYIKTTEKPIIIDNIFKYKSIELQIYYRLDYFREENILNNFVCLLNKPIIIDKLENININNQDINGNTALFYAIESRNIKIIEKLLEKKASLNIKNNNNKTPLQYAIDIEIEHNKMLEDFINYNRIEINKFFETDSTLKMNKPKDINKLAYLPIEKLNKKLGYIINNKYDLILKDIFNKKDELQPIKKIIKKIINKLNERFTFEKRLDLKIDIIRFIYESISESLKEIIETNLKLTIQESNLLSNELPNDILPDNISQELVKMVLNIGIENVDYKTIDQILMDIKINENIKSYYKTLFLTMTQLLIKIVNNYIKFIYNQYNGIVIIMLILDKIK